MKKLVLLLILFSITVSAQSKGAKTSLFMGGMDVKLGLGRDTVFNYFSANFKVNTYPKTDDYYNIMIVDKNTGYDIGKIGFRDNKVVDIFKTWYNTKVNNEVELMTSIFSMLKNIIGNDKFVETQISLYETNEPNFNSKTIIIVITNHWHINIEIIPDDRIIVQEALVD